MGINERIVQSEKFCTYITYHPSGKFYLGKGKTEDVLCGQYVGSGRALKCAIKKYPKCQWVTAVIEVFVDELDAYRHEAQLVADHLGSLGCLNLQGGGLGGRKASPETVEKNRQAQLLAQNRPEVQNKRSNTLKKILNTPEVRAIRSEKQRARWADSKKRVRALNGNAAAQLPEALEKRSNTMSKTLQNPSMLAKWRKAQEGMKRYHNPVTGKKTMAKIQPAGWLPGWPKERS